MVPPAAAPGVPPGLVADRSDGHGAGPHGAGPHGVVPRAWGPVGALLVHGVRTTRTMWRAQTEALERYGVPTVAVDLPGHGSRRADPFSLEAAEAALREGVEELRARGCRRLLLVGLSLGGYVALWFAGRNPGELEGGGLVAAACSTVPGRAVSGAYRWAAGLILRLPDHGAALNQWLVDVTLPPAGARDVAAGGFSLEVMDPVLREAPRIDPLSALRTLTCPVWIVNGRLDHFRVDERRYLRACRDGRLVVLPHAKHLANLDAPVAFTRVLLAAVDELAGADVAVGGAHASAGTPR